MLTSRFVVSTSLIAACSALGACNGGRRDLLPIVVLDVRPGDASDARTQDTITRPDVTRPDVTRPMDSSPDVLADAGHDAVDLEATTMDAIDVPSAPDVLDAPPPIDAGADDVLDASTLDTIDVPPPDAPDDVANDAGDDTIDAPDAADDVPDDVQDDDTFIPPGPPLIQVLLQWDGPGDLDVHLHNGNMTPWFTLNDAWAEQPTPAWGNPGNQDDAWVFQTNSTGEGPEWVQVQSPHPAERYVIGVHNFAGGAGRRATLQIYCGLGGGQVPFTLQSNVLAGTESGDCTGNDFWVAASAVLDASGACSITPIDMYVPSSTACTTAP